MFRPALAAMLLCVLSSATTLPAHAQPKAKEAPLSESRKQILEMVRLLEMPIETTGLHEPVKLKVALEYFSDKFGGKMTILVYKDAFPGADDPNEEDVKLPIHAKKMTMKTALQLILAQIANGKATYLIKPGYIAIVPEEYNRAPVFLRMSVHATYKKRPLHEVLDDLSDATGLSINLDPRVGNKANTAITAFFRNMPLEDALVTVTESADLKFVVLHDSVFVTTQGRAKVIEKEEKYRKKRRLEEPALPAKAAP